MADKRETEKGDAEQEKVAVAEVDDVAKETGRWLMEGALRIVYCEFREWHWQTGRLDGREGYEKRRSWPLNDRKIRNGGRGTRMKKRDRCAEESESDER